MMIDYAEIGKRLAKRRKELGLKQYQVCEMINVNYKYLSNLETGRSSPSLEALMDLCEALQVTPDYLLMGAVLDSKVSDEKITEKISRLSGKNKIIIQGIIDVLAENE